MAATVAATEAAVVIMHNRSEKNAAIDIIGDIKSILGAHWCLLTLLEFRDRVALLLIPAWHLAKPRVRTSRYSGGLAS
jgi:hypothetical protein